MNQLNLHRLIADRGVASRRGSERLVKDGRVTVNNAVVVDPTRLVDPATEDVRIDGERLPAPPRPIWLVLHKPKGTLTTREDPEGRPTIWSTLPELPANVEAVGRLDFHTEGVLILTNDGELAFRLTHPSYGVAKTYLVKVSGTPEPRKLRELSRGVKLEDGPTGPADVRMVDPRGPSSWILVTLAEGRNRVVRRLVDHIGHRVLKLKRVAFGGITLRGLEPGEARVLTLGEVDHLRRLVKDAGPARLEGSDEIEAAVAEALRLPTPPPRGPQSERPDAEVRPRRKGGWAKPKGQAVKPGWRKRAKAAREGVKVDRNRGEG